MRAASPPPRAQRLVFVGPFPVQSTVTRPQLPPSFADPREKVASSSCRTQRPRAHLGPGATAANGSGFTVSLANASRSDEAVGQWNAELWRQWRARCQTPTALGDANPARRVKGGNAGSAGKNMCSLGETNGPWAIATHLGAIAAGGMRSGSGSRGDLGQTARIQHSNGGRILFGIACSAALNCNMRSAPPPVGHHAFVFLWRPLTHVTSRGRRAAADDAARQLTPFARCLGPAGGGPAFRLSWVSRVSQGTRAHGENGPSDNLARLTCRAAGSATWAAVPGGRQDKVCSRHP